MISFIFLKLLALISYIVSSVLYVLLKLTRALFWLSGGLLFGAFVASRLCQPDSFVPSGLLGLGLAALFAAIALYVKLRGDEGGSIDSTPSADIKDMRKAIDEAKAELKSMKPKA